MESALLMQAASSIILSTFREGSLLSLLVHRYAFIEFSLAGWIGITVWPYKNPPNSINQPLFAWTDGHLGGLFVLDLTFRISLVLASQVFPSLGVSTSIAMV